MRAAAALVACLALVVSGCGSSDENVSARGAEAAELVPPDALAFVSADANLESEQWQTVSRLFGPIGIANEIPPAVGDELNLAVLGVEQGEPEVVAIVHSKDETKLRKVAESFDREGEHYTVERIGGWHVVADSPAAFQAVRTAESGRSLADVEAFQRAMSEVEGDALATAYADGARLKEVPGEIGGLVRVVGSPQWVGAKLVARRNAAQLDVHSDATVPVHRPRLLREVPSGALLAISFKNAAEVLRRLAAELDEYRTLFADLIPVVRGEGIIYVTQGALLPTIVLAVESPNPVAAAGALRRLGQELAEEANGFVSFEVARRGNRVTLTNAAVPPATPTRRLVDDQAFKDAFAAADAPDEVSWLAYADVERLAPTLEALSQLLGMRLSEEQSRTLAQLGTVVAFGARGRLVLRVSGR